MPKIQRSLFVIVFVSSFIFGASATANAQAMSSYLFVEVVDSNQKPVSEAKVEAPNYNEKTAQTNEKGQLRLQRLEWGERTLFSEFILTKPDFFAFHDLGGLQRPYNRHIKVELLKIPKSKNERKALGNEQLKRDFFWAIQSGDTETVRKLIKSGISPNLSIGDLRGISGVENIPAIIYPVFFGDAAMINLLLEAGADVRKKDEYIENILNYYLRANPLAKRQPKTEDEKAKILQEYDESLKALIKAGVNLNADDYGTTPLMIAVGNCRVRAVKILVGNGVDIDAKDKGGRTALSNAKEYQKYPTSCVDYLEIIKLLEAAGAKE